MRLAARCAIVALLAGAACRTEPPAPPLVAPVSGTIAIAGLTAPVRVRRDRWGVPHIEASSRDDLFVAQGFVQAQDRLFQMDLWRRAAQGRLAEVLGPNFIERDAMTRRVQYRGDLDAEWARYGPEARAIATAFVRGINAWVALARERPPEAFVLAGWPPDRWEPNDLLNRTDAFLASGDAIAEIARRHLSEVVADAIRRVGTPPFFAGLAAPVRRSDSASEVSSEAPAGSRRSAEREGGHADRDVELVTAAAAIPTAASVAVLRDGVVDVAESPRRFEVPSPRYLVHLRAPGWNAIGATAPWRPGIAIGHNDRVAWGSAPLDLDTQDIVVEPIDPAATRVEHDTIVVKGRAEPFPYDTERTPAGVVVASDREHGQHFALKWTGFGPGAAPELAALAIDVAQTRGELDAAIARWAMPPRRFVVASVDEGRARSVPTAAERMESAARGVTEQQAWVGDQPPSVVRALTQRASAGVGAEPARSTATRALFAHVLGITAAARRRFAIGPLPRPPRDDQPFRAQLDPRAWDASRVMSAPGQSESPDSPHYADLAATWAKGEMVPLIFSDAAIAANVESTLTLVPATTKPPKP